MARTTTVHGMSCEGTVESALTDVEGVTDADADRETEQATVEGDADPNDLAAVVEDAGYDAEA
jgi:copper chaperone CopZ